MADQDRTATTPTVQVYLADLLVLERALRNVPQNLLVPYAHSLNRLMDAIPPEAFRPASSGSYETPENTP